MLIPVLAAAAVLWLTLREVEQAEARLQQARAEYQEAVKARDANIYRSTAIPGGSIE